MDIAHAIDLLSWYARLDNHNCPDVALYARAQINALRSAAELRQPMDGETSPC
jgi:hypothetical protein